MDSVFQEHLPYNVFFTAEQHIFNEHLLQKSNLEPIIRVNNSQIWPSFFLFGCLFLLVLLKTQAFSKVIRIIQSTLSPQLYLKLEREEFNPFKFYSIALNLIFLLNVSFLIFKINQPKAYVLIHKSELIQYLFFLSLVSAIFILKIFVNRVLAGVTDKGKALLGYGTSSILINQSFGVFLFPLIILLQFSPLNSNAIIIVSLVLLGASILLKWYRGLMIGLVEERIGLLQIFSYFCGLEILPVFVLVKYIVETF